MLFWLVVILLVLSIILWLINNEYWEFTIIEYISLLSSCINTVLTVTLIGLIAINYTTADSDLAVRRERYKSLIYKAQKLEDCNEIEYLNEVQKWNESVVELKSLEKDFWYGIFYPNVYDELKTIDLENIGRKN